MPAPATSTELLELVARSGLVPDERCAAIRLAVEGKPNSPSALELSERLVREGDLTFFQAKQLLEGKWRGFTIGKYKVLERIGTGGMGQVYLCEHERMRRRVAIKVLPSAMAEDPSSFKRFEREARLAASLDHPNIVRTHDLDHDGRLHFIVMEYVDGSTLYELVRVGGQLSIDRACYYIAQAAVGLQYAHEAGLIHRDIKPSNIIVDRTGAVKILDLGLARDRFDEIDQLTRQYDDGNVLGTADYVAPEQTRDSHNVDIRADIYGLGATFYFCLAGRPPFHDGTPTQKLIWHQSRPPEPVQKLRPDLPLGIAIVVEKMMAKDLSRRFATPLEVVRALSPWTGSPIAPPGANELPVRSPAASQAGFPVQLAVAPIPKLPAQQVVPAASANPFAAPSPVTFPLRPTQEPKPRPGTNRLAAAVIVVFGIAAGILGGMWINTLKADGKVVDRSISQPKR